MNERSEELKEELVGTPSSSQTSRTHVPKQQDLRRPEK